jgi:hypothetical protein
MRKGYGRTGKEFCSGGLYQGSASFVNLLSDFLIEKSELAREGEPASRQLAKILSISTQLLAGIRDCTGYNKYKGVTL